MKTENLIARKNFDSIVESLDIKRLVEVVNMDTTKTNEEKQVLQRILTGVKNGTRTSLHENQVDYFNQLFGNFCNEEEFIKDYEKVITNADELNAKFAEFDMQEVPAEKLTEKILESFNKKYSLITAKFPEFNINESLSYDFYGRRAIMDTVQILEDAHKEAMKEDEGDEFSFDKYRQSLEKPVAESSEKELVDAIKELDDNSASLLHMKTFGRYPLPTENAKDKLLAYVQSGDDKTMLFDILFPSLTESAGFSLDDMSKYFDKDMLDIISTNKNDKMIAKTKGGSVLKVVREKPNSYRILIENLEGQDAEVISSEKYGDVHELKIVHEGCVYHYDGESIMEEKTGIVFEDGDREHKLLMPVVKNFFEDVMAKDMANVEENEEKIMSAYNNLTDDLVGFDPIMFDPENLDAARFEAYCAYIAKDLMVQETEVKRILSPKYGVNADII